MKQSDFLASLARRAGVGGVSLSSQLSDQLWSYFQLLTQWNAKVNLTGFALDAPTDAAIDRLFIEPVAAAAAIAPRPTTFIDIGSGGGSPGIPMSLGFSPQRTVLVETKGRKCVFLKEVVRVLDLSHQITIQTARFEDLAAAGEFSEGFECVSVRAVRVGEEELRTLSRFLKPRGQLVLFASEGQRTPAFSGIWDPSPVPLFLSGLGFASILTKA